MSRSRLEQLVNDGWIKRHAPGKYRLIDAVHGYIDFMRDERTRNSNRAADLRKLLAIFRRRRSRCAIVAERLGVVVPAEEFDEFIDGIAGIILTELGTLPARFTRDLTGAAADWSRMLCEFRKRLSRPLQADEPNAFQRLAATLCSVASPITTPEVWAINNRTHPKAHRSFTCGPRGAVSDAAYYSDRTGDPQLRR